MKVYFLGCGGWIPDKDETSCFMIEYKKQLFLLDAGTGVSNLRKYKHVIDKYNRINIILSHYHLDHIIGLIYLLPYIKHRELYLYGPGIPFYEKTTEEMVGVLLQPEYFSRPLLNFCENVKCFDYQEGDFYINNVKIEIKRQMHSSPSFRITIGEKLIYATDTIFDASEWEDSYQNMTLLHECWEVTSQIGSKHTSIEDLINGLPSYLLNSTYFIHKNPEWSKSDKEKIQNLVKNKGGCIAKDGMVIEI